MIGMVNIEGLDKAELLAALVNAARLLGLGFLHAGEDPMTKEEAQEWIDEVRSYDCDPIIAGRPLKFDYVRGRPIKLDLAGPEMNTRLYNRYQGEGAAERVVAELRDRT